uniref:Uncharacterized protein n=1 Tax=viral metagenome TaxID=1070528 RepID=A0A6C0CK35_9ZZZZ
MVYRLNQEYASAEKLRYIAENGSYHFKGFMNYGDFPQNGVDVLCEKCNKIVTFQPTISIACGKENEGDLCLQCCSVITTELSNDRPEHLITEIPTERPEEASKVVEASSTQSEILFEVYNHMKQNKLLTENTESQIIHYVKANGHFKKLKTPVSFKDLLTKNSKHIHKIHKDFLELHNNYPSIEKKKYVPEGMSSQKYDRHDSSSWMAQLKNQRLQRKPLPKGVCTRCNTYLNIYCDNMCGTMVCGECGTSFYESGGRLTYGHFPTCGMTSKQRRQYNRKMESNIRRANRRRGMMTRMGISMFTPPPDSESESSSGLPDTSASASASSTAREPACKPACKPVATPIKLDPEFADMTLMAINCLDPPIVNKKYEYKLSKPYKGFYNLNIKQLCLESDPCKHYVEELKQNLDGAEILKILTDHYDGTPHSHFLQYSYKLAAKPKNPAREMFEDDCYELKKPFNGSNKLYISKIVLLTNPPQYTVKGVGKLFAKDIGRIFKKYNDGVIPKGAPGYIEDDELKCSPDDFQETSDDPVARHYFENQPIEDSNPYSYMDRSMFIRRDWLSIFNKIPSDLRKENFVVDENSFIKSFDDSDGLQITFDLPVDLDILNYYSPKYQSHYQLRKRIIELVTPPKPEEPRGGLRTRMMIGMFQPKNPIEEGSRPKINNEYTTYHLKTPYNSQKTITLSTYPYDDQRGEYKLKSGPSVMVLTRKHIQQIFIDHNEGCIPPQFNDNLFAGVCLDDYILHPMGNANEDFVLISRKCYTDCESDQGTETDHFKHDKNADVALHKVITPSTQTAAYMTGEEILMMYVDNYFNNQYRCNPKIRVDCDTYNEYQSVLMQGWRDSVPKRWREIKTLPDNKCFGNFSKSTSKWCHTGYHHEFVYYKSYYEDDDSEPNMVYYEIYDPTYQRVFKASIDEIDFLFNIPNLEYTSEYMKKLRKYRFEKNLRDSWYANVRVYLNKYYKGSPYLEVHIPKQTQFKGKLSPELNEIKKFRVETMTTSEKDVYLTYDDIRKILDNTDTPYPDFLL